MQALSLCQCKVCVDCLRSYFTEQIRTRHVKNLVCPACDQPDIDNHETVEVHFQFLDLMVSYTYMYVYVCVYVYIYVCMYIYIYIYIYIVTLTVLFLS